LRGDVYVDVFTNTNATTINAVAQEQKMMFASKVPAAAQAYAQAKQLGVDLDKILPLKDLIKDMAA